MELLERATEGRLKLQSNFSSRRSDEAYLPLRLRMERTLWIEISLCALA